MSRRKEEGYAVAGRKGFPPGAACNIDKAGKKPKMQKEVFG